MESTKAIKRGTRILTEKPFAFVLKSKYRLERCDNCLEAAKVLKCSNCRYVSYCNRACQQAAWPLHKHECPFLKRVQPRVVPDAGRMLCRLILRLEHGGDLERGYYTEHGSRKFRDLMSHYAEIKNDAQRVEHLDSLHAVLTDMMIDSNSRSTVPNKTELMSIYGRLITNGFNILDAEMNSIGTAIYLGVSITDHSCQPNAVATFEGNELHVHATEDMPSLDWSKIFISYIDLLNTPEQRREDLKAHYYFLCVCSKCIDPQEQLDMNAAVCQGCAAAIDVEQPKCQCCNASVTAEQRQNYTETMSLTQSSLDAMKDVAYLDMCKVCLKKQSGVLHSLNVWHVKTLDAAFEAAIDVGKWSDALDYGQRLLPGFAKYHGAWNPLLGLLHMKLGKIQLYERNYKHAVHHLQEAHRILNVTHGRGHRLLHEQLQPLMLQARQEMSL
ncbi:Bzd [Drosophila busckii]|uniref:Bzd n=1 Tax=Drosophila busckii TaxID=30019 RepID=A0A0M4ET43_DROBS|nr:histone-lysine N-methyltransferase SMYD3 [Drosophila busckii]ALC49602.1 Bzd [Drosophila busckii]